MLRQYKYGYLCAQVVPTVFPDNRRLRVLHPESALGVSYKGKWGDSIHIAPQPSRHSVHMERPTEQFRDTSTPMNARRQHIFQLTTMYMQFNVHKEEVYNFFQGVSGQVISEADVLNWAFTNGHITRLQLEELLEYISYDQQATSHPSAQPWEAPEPTPAASYEDLRRQTAQPQEAQAETAQEIGLLKKNQTLILKEQKEVKSLLGRIWKALGKKKKKTPTPPMVDPFDAPSPPVQQPAAHSEETPEYPQYPQEAEPYTSPPAPPAASVYFTPPTGPSSSQALVPLIQPLQWWSGASSEAP